jgi:monofunctional biosynthetic peptidoglycan transglycosylase
MLLIGAAAAFASGRGGQMDTIFDFRSETRGWPSIDDVVMGGVSSSDMTVVDGVAVFTGRLSLDRGGGFCSVRTRPGAFDLSDYDALVVRARGDGKRYKLRLRTTDAFDGVSYEHGFETRAGEWQEHELALARFRPVFRGRAVPGAPPPDLSEVRTFGLLISDRQEGPFRLEIEWIAGRTVGATVGR